MRSSLFLAATGAMLAAANPVKRVVVVETDIDVVYTETTVVVDAGAPTPAPAAPAVTPVVVQAPQVPSNNKKQPKPSADSSPAVVYVTETAKPSPTPAPASSAKPSTVVAVPASGASAASPSDPMASTALNAHNVHRANHSAPAMTWSDDLAASSQLLANTCDFHHDTSLGPAKNYGQNIAMYGTTSGLQALGDGGAIGMATHDMWYNGEVTKFLPSYYGQASPDMGSFEDWGHFSQLVWAGSNQVGCAVKLCNKGDGSISSSMPAYYMVCNYLPAGNMGGAYGKNVLAPEGHPTVTN